MSARCSPADFLDFLNSVQKGESVLIEYSSFAPLHVIFSELVKCASVRGFRILVVDVLDSLHVIKSHAILGKNELPEDIDVLKCGGIIEVGNVIKKKLTSQWSPWFTFMNFRVFCRSTI